jgi:hypothetical protein
MLDELVPDHLKVSNDLVLIGWLPTMSIQTTIAQLEALYGKPTATILLNNNKLFSSDFLPNDAPNVIPLH